MRVRIIHCWILPFLWSSWLGGGGDRGLSILDDRNGGCTRLVWWGESVNIPFWIIYLGSQIHICNGRHVQVFTPRPRSPNPLVFSCEFLMITSALYYKIMVRVLYGRLCVFGVWFVLRDGVCRMKVIIGASGHISTRVLIRSHRDMIFIFYPGLFLKINFDLASFSIKNRQKRKRQKSKW